MFLGFSEFRANAAIYGALPFVVWLASIGTFRVHSVLDLTTPMSGGKQDFMDPVTPSPVWVPRVPHPM